MIKNLSSLIRYFLFWYVIFLASRVVFILLNWKESTEAGWSILNAFVYGFRLDIAMTCYLTVIPVLLWCLSQYFQQKVWLNRLLKFYNIILLTCIVIITLADGELYQHWGQKLNAYASSFAKFPKEMLVFSASGSALKFVGIIVGFLAFAYWVYAKGMKGLDEMNQVSWWKPIVASLVIWSFLFLGI